MTTTSLLSDMAAIKITVHYEQSPGHYREGDNELERTEEDIESLQNGSLDIGEFIENAVDVTYDPMPGYRVN